MPWEDRARCRDLDPDLFFAPRSISERRAKVVCSGCPVRTECLGYALDLRIEFGVWGGLSGRERRAMFKRPA